MITVGHIRCDLDRSEVGLLQPPSGAPVYHASAIDQPGPVYPDMWGNQM